MLDKLNQLTESHGELKAGRGMVSGVIALTAATVADLPVEQVDGQLRNCGVYRQAATA